MLNHVTAQGRIGKSIELRRTNSGKAVSSFSIACDRDFKSQDGTRETDWFDVVCWGATAEFCERFLHKGSNVIVSGRLQTRKWQDKNGNNRVSTEIVADNVYFGDSKHDSEGTASTSYQSPGYTAPAPASDFAMLEDEDAQLPF